MKYKLGTVPNLTAIYKLVLLITFVKNVWLAKIFTFLNVEVFELLKNENSFYSQLTINEFERFFKLEDSKPITFFMVNQFEGLKDNNAQA